MDIVKSYFDKYVNSIISSYVYQLTNTNEVIEELKTLQNKNFCNDLIQKVSIHSEFIGVSTLRNISNYPEVLSIDTYIPLREQIEFSREVIEDSNEISYWWLEQNMVITITVELEEFYDYDILRHTDRIITKKLDVYNREYSGYLRMMDGWNLVYIMKYKNCFLEIRVIGQFEED